MLAWYIYIIPHGYSPQVILTSRIKNQVNVIVSRYAGSLPHGATLEDFSGFNGRTPPLGSRRRTKLSHWPCYPLSETLFSTFKKSTFPATSAYPTTYPLGMVTLGSGLVGLFAR